MYQYLYWLCLLFLVAYIVFDYYSLSKLSKFALYIPLFLLMAMAMAMTVHAFDVGTYRVIYYRLTSPPGAWRIDMFPEFGFQYLNYFFNGVLSWSFESFRFVYAFVTLIILYLSVSRLTNKQGLFFILYYPKYFLMGLISHTRSGFVNAFIFFCIDLASRKKYFSVFIISLCLSQIHFSAVLLNVISILQPIKLRLFYVLMVIPFSILFSKIGLPFVIDYAQIIDLRQLNYLVGDDEVARGLFGVEFFRRSALILVCAYIVFYDKAIGDAESLVIKVFILSVFVYIGFHEAKFIADRVGGMLGFVEPMMWVMFIQNHLRAFNKLVAFFLVSSYLLVDIYLRGVVIDVFPEHMSINTFLGGFI